MAFDIGGASTVVVQVGMGLLFIIMIIMVIAIIFFLVQKQRRFDYRCIIFEKDGFNQPIFSYDSGGVFVDNITRNKLFWMKNANVGLKPDNIPYIQDGKGRRYVFLKRLGLKNFAFISFREMFVTNVPIMVGEEDVNWGAVAYERQKAAFGNDMLTKLLPYFGIILLGVFAIGLVYLVYQQMPQLAQVTKDLKDVATLLASRGQGTTVITSGGG